MANNNKSIAIIGAGLVGSLMAIYLRKRKYNVSIYERRADLRKSKPLSGKSINLALSARGWKALAEIGLDAVIKKISIPMNGRMIHDTQSNLSFQSYGKKGQAIHSVSRRALNLSLIEQAEKIGVNIYFDHKCIEANPASSKVTLNYLGETIEVTKDIIIGADGAFSIVRQTFQKTDRFDYSQQYIAHGYKEFVIPAGKIEGAFLMEKNALHIWPRGNYMLIALPNTDGSFTCTLFFPFEGKLSFEALKSDEEIIRFFKKTFPDAVSLIPTLLEEYRENPISSLVTVKCYPWVKNKTLIIGDAAHAIVPFYGQGMNAGFEDCRILNQMLDEHHDNWDKVLPAYQALRKIDADAISDLALQNFIEMSDHVRDDYFLTRKKIEAKLHKAYPDQWIPLYTMVTFENNIRYSDAVKRGNIQKSIMDKVMKRPGIIKVWDKINLEEIVKG